MADSESRLANLKAIMQWSLRQAPSGESPAMPTDPEVSQVYSAYCLQGKHSISLSLDPNVSDNHALFWYL